MDRELENIIELIKSKEFELAYQLLIGNPSIYMDCSDEDFAEIHQAFFPQYDNENDITNKEWLKEDDRINWLHYWLSLSLHLPFKIIPIR